MLTIMGRSSTGFCDGINRRSFLRIGALAAGATSLSLADVMRAEATQAEAGRPRRQKSVINIFLAGGPPHQDMWEIKTEAPAEIRGEFQPIATNVPGIQICEVFPQLAELMDKAVVIFAPWWAPRRPRILAVPERLDRDGDAASGGRPSMGSVLPNFTAQSIPRCRLTWAWPRTHTPWSDPGTPGFLGTSFAPFQPDGPGMDNMKLNDISLERLQDRRQLLSSLDTLRATSTPREPWRGWTPSDNVPSMC